ncbi:sigma-70 family RNA polymerase sigma factor [candidate division KSB1 bacterium]|nr:sigma-70 family RNA polymerase sigma factor [candidate division KSB1 bacterium]
MKNAGGTIFANFKDFLEVLVDRSHDSHQAAWKEFDRRYRSIILAKIHKITSLYADVEEVISRIMTKLVSNDFKLLRDFRTKDSEVAFRVWLSQIAITTALGYVTSLKKTIPLNEELPIEDKNTEKQHENSYKKSSKLLRAASAGTKKKKFNQQRDIFIYLLRREGRFGSKEVAQIPLAKTTSHNVDVIVDRVEDLINKKGNKLRDLL